MSKQLIAKAVAIVGTQKALAAAIGCKQPFVNKMLKKGVVPAARCIAIEKATSGLVTRYELRPDVFGDRAA